MARNRTLERIASALEWLADAADPQSAIRYDTAGGSARNEWPDPGAATRRWRTLRNRFMKRLERTANELEAEIQGDDVYRKNQGWRCSRCNRYSHRNASFCGNCGIPKPGDVA